VTFSPKLLNEDEDIVLDLRPHWSTLARPVLAVLLAIAVMLVLAELINGPYWIAGAVLSGWALAWFVLRYAKWATTNFVVTTDRLVYRVGVLAKRGKEIPLERVNDIAFRQSIWERIIGTGDLSIESAGAQSRETFSDIPHPAAVQNEIYRQMEASAGRHADRMAGGRRELSIPEQIEKLDELRQRGIVSEAEFEVKKRQLLDRM
jgi:uncharacterized membrane protein YdbT with pleckstrin-like domain